ncbi:MAG: DMT family transporter [Candidatus Dormiibacterota bacterium]
MGSVVAWRGSRLGGAVGWGDALVLTATILWSVNVVVVKLALADSGPLTYSAIRYLVGGLALMGLARGLEGAAVLPRGRDALVLVAAAVTGVLINQTSFTVALSLTNPDNVAMISGITPLLVASWFVWRHRERFGVRVWVGLVLGFAGLVLVVGAGVWSSWLGILIALGNPLSWAVYLLLLPRLLGRYGPLTLAALVTMLGALMLLPLGALEAARHHPQVSGHWLGLLAYSTVLALVLTSWLYLLGVRRLGPARAAVYVYLQPFLAVVAAGVLIGEPILPLQLLGGVIMLIGVAWGRPRPRPSPVPRHVESSVVGGLPSVT